MNTATEAFLQELKRDPNVIGVIMFGSWARGNNRDDSDVDLVVLLEDGYKRAIHERDGQMFEIIYTTPTVALTYWEDHQDDCAGLWDVAKILYSKDGVVEAVQQKVVDILQGGKAPIPETQREQLLFDKRDKLKYIQRIYAQDETTANLMLYNTASELTALFFDLRQKWTPAPKQRLQRIEEMSSDFMAHLRELYADGTPPHRRFELLEKMIALVFDK